MQNEELSNEEKGNDTTPLVRRSFSFDYAFGYISDGGYRHFPILYFAHGNNGFTICILGANFTIKLW